jgi:hypothetical protein
MTLLKVPPGMFESAAYIVFFGKTVFFLPETWLWHANGCFSLADTLFYCKPAALRSEKRCIKDPMTWVEDLPAPLQKLPAWLKIDPRCPKDDPAYRADVKRHLPAIQALQKADLPCPKHDQGCAANDQGFVSREKSWPA